VRSKFLLSIAMLAAAALTIYLGYELINQSLPRTSGIEIGFTEAEKLDALPAGVANRITLYVHNTSNSVARIVGNNAC
jgi:hypothetical protein